MPGNRGVQHGEQAHRLAIGAQQLGDGVGHRATGRPAEQVIGPVWLYRADLGDVVGRHVVEGLGELDLPGQTAGLKRVDRLLPVEML